MVIISSNFTVWERDAILAPLGLNRQLAKEAGIGWQANGLQRVAEEECPDILFVKPSNFYNLAKYYIGWCPLDAIYCCLHGAEWLHDFDSLVKEFPRKPLYIHMERAKNGPVKRWVTALGKSLEQLSREEYEQRLAKLQQSIVRSCPDLLARQIVAQYRLFDGWQLSLEAGTPPPAIWQLLFDRYPDLPPLFRQFVHAASPAEKNLIIDQVVACLEAS